MKPGSPRLLRSLYVCYLSLDDPLTRTQVVAYLQGLAAAGHTIHLLTFEPRRMPRTERRDRRRQMRDLGVRWHHLRYHKRPSLPATAYDTLLGAGYVLLLSLRFRLEVVHARAHVPAAMAILARRLRRRPPALIFDIRGLMGEEYVDAGRWQRDGLPFRLVKSVERAALLRSAGIVVLTTRVRGLLFGDVPDPRVFVIPCCADLDTLAGAHARRDTIAPESARTTMVYVGKLEGWYMAPEMADFFSVARQQIPDLHFLILTQGTHKPISSRLEQLGLMSDVTITSAPADEVGKHLATADFGISFIQPCESKASSSPTKVGEYLAAGLPVIATAGVGDLDMLLGPDVGVLVSDHDQAAHREATASVVRLLSDPGTGARCTALAQSELSLEAVGVPRYRALYQHVASILTSRDDAGKARV
jgi:glycosyltransferase involved in cell wall biosynthesis